MNYSHFDFSEKNIFKRIGIIACVSAIGEAVSYPFDRIKVREMARRVFVSGSVFKESKMIYNDIMKAENKFGLTYGLRSAVDKVIAMNLARFLAFDFLIGRPSDPYKLITNFNLYLSAFGAQSIGFLLSQPSNILKIKVQCEPLGMDYSKYESYSEKYRRVSSFHKGKPAIFFSTGFKSGIILQNALAAGEIFTFFKLLRFLYEETNIKSDYFKVCVSALITANVTTLLAHPLDFLNTRYSIRQLQGETPPVFYKYIQQVIKEEMGIATLYKGIVPSLIKNSITAVATFGLWNFFSTQSRHEALYNYYGRKHQQVIDKQHIPKGFEMTGGRKDIR